MAGIWRERKEVIVSSSIPKNPEQLQWREKKVLTFRVAL